MSAAATSARDCRAFGCVGLVRCDYCDALLPGPETDVVLLAASRVRMGDSLGALRTLQAFTGVPS